MIRLSRHIVRAAVAVALVATAAVAVPELSRADVDTLHLWMMDNGLGSQKAVKKLVKKFQRDTGIPVEVRVLNWGEAYDVITKAFASPDSVADFPDVIQLGSTWVPHFASVGSIRPLDSLIAQVDSSRFYAESFRASHIGAGKEVYSFPWFLDVRALFANEWLWHTLGIEESDIASYSKFMGALRAINRGELKNSEMKRVAAFALPGHEDWTGPQQMAPFIWNFGGDFLDCRQGACTSALLDQKTLDGLAVYAAILGDEELAPQSLHENSQQNAVRFINSELLIHYGTSELIRQLEFSEEAGGLRSSAIADDGIIILPFLASSFKSTFVGGSHLALPTGGDSTKFAAAQSLLAYLLRTDNLDAYCRAVGFLPSDRGLISIWNQDRRYSQLVQSLESGKSFPNIPQWGAIEGVLIKFANDMGSMFAVTEDKAARNHELAELLVQAHFRIMEILGQKETEKEAGLVARAETAFATEIQEIEPEDLQFEPLPTPQPAWRMVFFAGIAAGLVMIALFARLVVYFVHNRKKKGTKS
jgi:multiple sugar transport system substrate-binding protein